MHGEYKVPGGKLVAADVEVGRRKAVRRCRFPVISSWNRTRRWTPINAILTGLPAETDAAALTQCGRGGDRPGRHDGRFLTGIRGDRGAARARAGHQLA